MRDFLNAKISTLRGLLFIFIPAIFTILAHFYTARPSGGDLIVVISALAICLTSSFLLFLFLTDLTNQLKE